MCSLKCSLKIWGVGKLLMASGRSFHDLAPENLKKRSPVSVLTAVWEMLVLVVDLRGVIRMSVHLRLYTIQQIIWGQAINTLVHRDIFKQYSSRWRACIHFNSAYNPISFKNYWSKLVDVRIFKTTLLECSCSCLRASYIFSHLWSPINYSDFLVL